MRLGCIRHNRNAIAGNRTTRSRGRNSQCELGRPGAVRAPAIARDRSLEEGDGRGRHGETVLPLTGQEQLVWIRDGSQIGGCFAATDVWTEKKSKIGEGSRDKESWGRQWLPAVSEGSVKDTG